MHGRAHRGDISDTYITLDMNISTVLVQIHYNIQVAIITGHFESCVSPLYVKQKEVRGCTAGHTGETYRILTLSLI